MAAPELDPRARRTYLLVSYSVPTATWTIMKAVPVGLDYIEEPVQRGFQSKTAAEARMKVLTKELNL